MLEQDYKELMNEVGPEEAMVEAMVERQKAGRRAAFFPRMMKTAAAVLCGLVVLAGGAVVADAATDGAVRKLFGLKDSVAIGTGGVEASFGEDVEDGEYIRLTDGDELNVKVVVGDDETTYFVCHLSSTKTTLQMGFVLDEDDTEEDCAWAIYSFLHNHVSSRRNDTEFCKSLIVDLEICKEQITGEDLFRNGCIMGIQMMIDDLSAGKATEICSIPVLDYHDEDGDGDMFEYKGDSYVVIYPEDWKKETEENGTTEFVVEAQGGIPGTYLMKVTGYNPLEYTYFDMSMDYSQFGE